MPTKPTILKQEIVASSRLFRVERCELRFSNGEERTYERLSPASVSAVMVVAMKDPETVLLIREYCGGMDSYQLSLPKGAMDPGEGVFEAANRELMEEVGYGAKRFTTLKKMSLSPGYMGHMINTVLAEDLYEEKLPGDEPEPIDVIEHPIEDIDSLLQAEDFTEARAFAALYMVRDILRQRND